jgi:sugar/nucleoside kinase (ribokinase family)
VKEQPAFLHHEFADAIGAGDSFDAGFISDLYRINLWRNVLNWVLYAALSTQQLMVALLRLEALNAIKKLPMKNLITP